jgi:hypothetical protein
LPWSETLPKVEIVLVFVESMYVDAPAEMVNASAARAATMPTRRRRFL